MTNGHIHLSQLWQIEKYCWTSLIFFNSENEDIFSFTTVIKDLLPCDVINDWTFQGGAVAFPLMVPVLPNDRYVDDFRRTRHFLSTKWHKPTLVVYSEQSIIPLLQRGDFIVGNRRLFYNLLIPQARVADRVEGGHVVMYDNPRVVGNHIKNFIYHWNKINVFCLFSCFFNKKSEFDKQYLFCGKKETLKVSKCWLQ